MSEAPTLEGGRIDLSDPQFYATGDPVPVWAWLRANEPVYRNPPTVGHESGFWALTKYADQVAVLRNTRDFTSEAGMLLGHQDEAALATSGRMLVVSDPPYHTKLRRILAPAFGPRPVARLRSNLGETISGLVRERLDGEEFDFVSDIAARIPTTVVCDMMGVPREDWDWMSRLTSSAFGWDLDEGRPATKEEREESNAEIYLYYMDLIPQRRETPGEDVISALVTGTIDGKPLSDDDVMLNCGGIVTAGNETTRHAASGAMLAFTQFPDQYAALRGTDGLLEPAVEEILRWTTPGLHVLRTCTNRVEIRGVAIQPGDTVTLWTPSANRDEDVFEEPDALRLTRDPNRHLSFGFGAHYCLGAAMARLELAVLLDQVRTHVRDIELTRPYVRLADTFLWGFGRMPLRFHPH
jgi:cytochrome P450